MPHSLIIVESPTKVKTIKKFLGPDFEIQATKGHVKDLPKSKLGIDIEKGFEPTYKIMDSRKKTIDDLKRAAKHCENIYLAPDPDREGEAIAWHIAEEIGGKGKQIYRVLFNDLTKHTVLEAIQHPLNLDLNKYEAQQTRRILDRLVGYKISPLLWDRVRRGLSAGRVQSVAVRLICDREEEIRKFVPDEYWNISASLEGKNPPPLEAKLLRIDGKKAKVGNQEQADQILAYLNGHPFTVAKVEKKETKRSPAPPFTTSKLQQEASRWLNFSAKKTMSVAQKLYEGIELGAEGPVGLITYMRTDSVRIAQEALHEAREYIKTEYDHHYLPAKPHVFKNAGSAQDAHEAVRPSSMKYKPADIKNYLSHDEFRLYQLIWNRFIASQMASAVFDLTTIDIACGPYIFRAQGSIMKFPGFTVVYKERKEDNGQDAEEEFGKILPDVSPDEVLKLLSLKPEQKFTQPPPRFSESSLVRELEEKGIGRPSTYASILSTIQDREYARLEEKKFHPTELGGIVTDLLVKNFPKILDVTFTASMETKLDQIEQGQLQRLTTLTDFYKDFSAELKNAEGGMEKIKGEGIPTDQICDKCGSPMVIKLGRNGRFMACSGYPSCKNTMNLNGSADGPPEPEASDVTCNLCGKPMVFKQGRFGKFLACSGYPECKNTMKINGRQKSDQPESVEISDQACEKCGKPMAFKEGRYGRFLGCTGYPKCKNIRPLSLGVNCPETGCTGYLSEKRSRMGKPFFSCSRYPDCKYAIWYRPIPEPCPQCGAPFLVDKTLKDGRFKACLDKQCKYKVPVPNE